MNEIKTTNKRIYSFDIMRIIAVCAVVMIHTSADFVIPSQNSAVGFICANLLNSLSRFSVPVFLMVSGALMLNEDKELSNRKLLKSTSNIFLLLVAWSVLYAIGYNIVKPIVFNETISMSAILNTIFNGHYHLWFLFVLIGLYLITPILRFFIKRENSKLIRNYLIFSVIICFGISFADQILTLSISQDNVLFNYISNFRFDYIYEYLIYYILGWYLTNVEIKKNTRLFLYVCGAIGALITFACTQIFFTNPDVVNNYFYSNISLNVFIYSISVFVFIHYIFKNRNFTLNKVVSKLSNLTFGVYLIHCMFLFVFKAICEKLVFPPLQICVAFVGTLITSYIAVYVLSKIPFLKKLIRG